MRQPTQCDTLGVWRVRSPFDPPEARAPAEFTGGELAPLLWDGKEG